MVSRKVPVHRAPRSPGTGAARTVSRPGVSSDGKSNFYSPFQPPPASHDLAGDVSALDPEAWHTVHAADLFWRVRIPGPSALNTLARIQELKGRDQLQVMSQFISEHLHPEDTATMLERMMDPDDNFGTHEYQALYRAVVTVGTARPFWQSSVLPAPLFTVGALCEPSYISVAFQTRSKH